MRVGSETGLVARLRGIFRDERGQSSVEYALVFFALLAIVVALAALWRAGSRGALVQRAAESASHALGQDGIGGMQDILLY